MVITMKSAATAAAVAVLALGVSACGETKLDRALSGGGIGAGVGAAGAAIVGGSVAGGAALGAAVGAATGALTDSEDIDLGDSLLGN